ncbi:cadherin domain-containing protein [Paracoccus litorisediminis]|uniref:cadherin domain-containing protein n=1 Tax=Paracoccus litorisediminis TaxID=2006130 RepID=UPI00147897E5
MSTEPNLAPIAAAAAAAPGSGITIDASTATAGINWATFIGDYVSGAGSFKFYGGEFTPFFGAPQAVSGSQVAYSFPGSQGLFVLEGSSLAYDWIRYGTSYPHALSGQLDGLTFGNWVEGQTSATQGTGAAGSIAGLDTQLVITGLGVDVAPGTGASSDTVSNPVMDMHSAASSGNAGAVYDLLSDYAQNFIGSAHADSFTGSAQNDTIDGGAGDDTLDGGEGADIINGGAGNDLIQSGAGDDTIDGGAGTDTLVLEGNFGGPGGYTFTGGTGGAPLVITDPSGGTGTDTLTNVEILKFDNLTYDLVNHRANFTPTGLALSNASIAETAAVGATVGAISVTDRETTDTYTYELVNSAEDRFVIENGEVRVAAPLTDGSYDIEVLVTDSAGNSYQQALTVTVTEPPVITIDASGASAGMDLEAFIRGGFLQGISGGGMPVFDNGTNFSGTEAMLAYGSDPSSSYILTRGALEYYFGTHTVTGEIDTIEYGTRGTGSYDASGAFIGGDAELRISGLEFANARPTTPTEEAQIEANGAVHNFVIAHMYGSAGSQARLDAYADALDEYRQHFIGSAGNDVYTGSRFNDTIEGAGGNDLLNGGEGTDVAVFDGVFGGPSGSYSFSGGMGGAPLVITDSRAGGTGIDTLTNIELLRFDNLTYDFVNHRANYTPTDVALSNAEVIGSAVAGTVVGSLTATDRETTDTHSFALVDDADGRFRIVGNEIRVTGTAPLSHDNYVLTIRVTDGAGNEFDKQITIAVEDPVANTAPATVTLSATGIAENSANGTVVGILSATDADGDALTYSLTNNAGGRFALVTQNGQTRLVVNGALDYETATSHQIAVQVSDGRGGVVTQNFTVGVTDVLGRLITGTAAADLLNGTPEGDTLNGGAGADTLRGGIGNDIYIVDNAGDLVVELAGQGTDTVRATVTHTLAANVENLELQGTAAIGGTGNALANRITGNAGANALNGASGNDTLIGGAGNDTLNGGLGADVMQGGAGNDVYIIDNAGDRVTELAGAGIDTVRSSTLSQVLGANVENLELQGSAALSGTGNALANRITGNSGANALNGAAGNDTLIGGAGNDTLNGGLGADAMQGGIGNDLYFVDNLGDRITEAANAGTDTVRATVSHVLSANIENLELQGGALNGTGNAGANRITGTAGANALNGAAGNDTLIGGAGNDSLNGGTGIDQMSGGVGNDTYYVDHASDRVIELSGQGVDTVRSTISHTLGANVENLILTGTAAVNATGNAVANALTGNSGANVLMGYAGNDVLNGGAGDDKLFGGVGNDRLIGGAGADILRGGEGSDVFVFTSLRDSTTSLAGRDSIWDFTKGADRIDLSQIDANTETAGDQAFSFIGNAAFSGEAGELRFVNVNGQSLVHADVNGDGRTDFTIHFDDKLTFTQSDFLL